MGLVKGKAERLEEKQDELVASVTTCILKTAKSIWLILTNMPSAEISMAKGVMDFSPKLVTIKDIAKEAGVSISTVSFALNNPERVSAQTRRHVLRIAREMDYTRVKKLRKRDL